jgi:hypothetical protein
MRPLRPAAPSLLAGFVPVDLCLAATTRGLTRRALVAKASNKNMALRSIPLRSVDLQESARTPEVRLRVNAFGNASVCLRVAGRRSAAETTGAGGSLIRTVRQNKRVKEGDPRANSGEQQFKGPSRWLGSGPVGIVKLRAAGAGAEETIRDAVRAVRAAASGARSVVCRSGAGTTSAEWHGNLSSVRLAVRRRLDPLQRRRLARVRDLFGAPSVMYGLASARTGRGGDDPGVRGHCLLFVSDERALEVSGLLRGASSLEPFDAPTSCQGAKWAGGAGKRVMSRSAEGALLSGNAVPEKRPRPNDAETLAPS